MADDDWEAESAGFKPMASVSTDQNNNDSEKTTNGFGSGRSGFGGGFRSRDQSGGEKKEGGFGGGGFGGGFRNRDQNGGEGGFGGGRREGGGSCFKCGEKGHMSRECTNPPKDGGGGGGDRACYKCGEKGHMSRECTNPPKEGGFGGGRREGGGGFGRSRDGSGGGFGERKEGGGFGSRGGFGGGGDKSEGSGFGSRGGFGGGDKSEGGFGSRGGFGNKDSSGGGDRGCYKCGEKGHMSRECTNPPKEGGSFGSRREGGGGGDGSCFKCGEQGHMSRECTNPPKDKKEGENGEVKRERYIPEDQVDNEENLFQPISTGVNFRKQSEIPAEVSGDGAELIVPIKNFNEAKLSDLMLENVKKSKYEIPTPVQKYAIPIIIQKRDLMACAQTGSGKTAAFVLPIMTNILHDGIESSSLMSVQMPQALILSPTRELALQTYNECKKFSYQSMIKSGILYGGVDTGYQLSQLSKGCNILVATPGRLLDVVEKGKVSLEKVKYFVLDEADRMLDMGFEKSVRDILLKGIKPKGERVTLMFSATFPKEIQQLAQDFLNNYLFLTVGVVGGANTDVEQTVHKVNKFEKRDKVVEILNEIGNDKTMIFIEKKKDADIIGFFLLQKGYPTTTIHGDRLQSQREEALRSFKSGKNNIIVCTSVAARGLDIEKVNHVINFDMPKEIDEYVHRIGRTGRCGNIGKAISFFDPTSENDMKLARPLVRILTQAQKTVPAWLNDLAEDSVGSAFVGNACTDDMRNKMNKMNIASNTPSAKQEDEEAWD